MEYASNEIRNMEHQHEKGNTGQSPCMILGIWNHEIYPILEYGKSENMKLGTWNKVSLKFELGNVHDPLGSPGSVRWVLKERWFRRGVQDLSAGYRHKSTPKAAFYSNFGINTGCAR